MLVLLLFCAAGHAPSAITEVRIAFGCRCGRRCRHSLHFVLAVAVAVAAAISRFPKQLNMQHLACTAFWLCACPAAPLAASAGAAVRHLDTHAALHVP
jgi:hypothetical protein